MCTSHACWCRKRCGGRDPADTRPHLNGKERILKNIIIMELKGIVHPHKKYFTHLLFTTWTKEALAPFSDLRNHSGVSQVERRSAGCVAVSCVHATCTRFQLEGNSGHFGKKHGIYVVVFRQLDDTTRAVWRQVMLF